MSVHEQALYVAGHRVADPQTIEETAARLADGESIAWIDLVCPDEDELRNVADRFALHELAIEDALKGHQRAKLERYGTTLFVVLRPARYIDETEKVEFGEIHLFIGTSFAITIQQTRWSDLTPVRTRLDSDSSLLARGPDTVLYAILDHVVDGYGPVVTGVERDIDEIEDQIFDEGHEISQRIYELAREVLAFQRATSPLVKMLEGLERGFDKYNVDVELHRSLRDVLDHVIRVVEQVDTFRTLLQNALTANATLVAQRENEEMWALTEASLAQNDDMKRISSWAAIIVTPTLIGSIYGMNFDRMPELHWHYGYPISLAVMVAMAAGLYVVFKRKSWL